MDADIPSLTDLMKLLQEQFGDGDDSGSCSADYENEKEEERSSHCAAKVALVMELLKTVKHLDGCDEAGRWMISRFLREHLTNTEEEIYFVFRVAAVRRTALNVLRYLHEHDDDFGLMMVEMVSDIVDEDMDMGEDGNDAVIMRALEVVLCLLEVKCDVCLYCIIHQLVGGCNILIRFPFRTGVQFDDASMQGLLPLLYRAVQSHDVVCRAAAIRCFGIFSLHNQVNIALRLILDCLLICVLAVCV